MGPSSWIAVVLASLSLSQPSASSRPVCRVSVDQTCSAGTGACHQTAIFFDTLSDMLRTSATRQCLLVFIIVLRQLLAFAGQFVSPLSVTLVFMTICDFTLETTELQQK